MNRMKQSLIALSFVFSVMALSPNAAAVGLEYYGVEVTIKDDLSVNNLVVLDFDAPINRLDYTLDFRVENLQYNADFDFADCSVSDNRDGSTISCTFIGMTQENNKLTLDFDTSNVINKIEDDYRFTVNYGIPLSIERTFILIRLPQNNILAGEEGKSFFPASGGTLTDGKRIMIFWEDEALETGKDLQFSLLFTRPPAVESTTLIYLIAAIAIVAISLTIFYSRRGRGSSVAIVKSVLNKDEKRIIDLLNERGGKAGQKLLVRESDFSKAKVSRIVKNLRERGVVETEPISGRENRVLLSLGIEKPSTTTQVE